MSVCRGLFVALLAIFVLQSPVSIAATDMHGQELKVKASGAVSNEGAGKIEEKPDVTLDYRIAEADEMVSRSMIAATDMYKEGKIAKEMWPCVKAKLEKASKDIDIARETYRAGNSEDAVFITKMVEWNISALNTDLQN